jgi:hypothetical protein
MDATNPRAFPSSAVEDAYGGMSLRDYFAGQALIGLLANPGNVILRSEVLTTRCYLIANAMLNERNKP